MAAFFMTKTIHPTDSLHCYFLRSPSRSGYKKNKRRLDDTKNLRRWSKVLRFPRTLKQGAPRPMTPMNDFGSSRYQPPTTTILKQFKTPIKRVFRRLLWKSTQKIWLILMNRFMNQEIKDAHHYSHSYLFDCINLEIFWKFYSFGGEIRWMDSKLSKDSTLFF